MNLLIIMHSNIISPKNSLMNILNFIQYPNITFIKLQRGSEKITFEMLIKRKSDRSTIFHIMRIVIEVLALHQGLLTDRVQITIPCSLGSKG